jgi:hypothetical protein
MSAGQDWLYCCVYQIEKRIIFCKIAGHDGQINAASVIASASEAIQMQGGQSEACPPSQLPRSWWARRICAFAHPTPCSAAAIVGRISGRCNPPPRWFSADCADANPPCAAEFAKGRKPASLHFILSVMKRVPWHLTYFFCTLRSRRNRDGNTTAYPCELRG